MSSIEWYYNITHSKKRKTHTIITNQAIERTNFNVEALKERMGGRIKDASFIEKNYGKELLLILQNYLIQKYYKEYQIYTVGAFEDERLFFYRYPSDVDQGSVAVIDINKGRYYLSNFITENKDMLTSILCYCYVGFDEIGSQILKSCSNSPTQGENNYDSEITLTIYQLTTIGSCLGYFDTILSSDELSHSQKDIMAQFLKENILIRHHEKILLVNRFTGELTLYNQQRIDFRTWCNYDIGEGLEFITKL